MKNSRKWESGKYSVWVSSLGTPQGILPLVVVLLKNEAPKREKRGPFVILISDLFLFELSRKGH